MLISKQELENKFQATLTGTKVVMEITFAKLEDLKTIIELGFEQGLTSALINLDYYFCTHF